MDFEPGDHHSPRLYSTSVNLFPFCTYTCLASLAFCGYRQPNLSFYNSPPPLFRYHSYRVWGMKGAFVFDTEMSNIEMLWAARWASML